MRRHFKRPELDEPQAAGRSIGRVELVDAELGPVRVAGRIDQQIAKDAIDEPRWHAAPFANLAIELVEGELQLIDRVVASFIDARRLARGTDKQPAEQVTQRRMVEPIRHERTEQIGPPQEGAVRRRGAAQDNVISAAGSRVAAIEHEFLGPQPAEPRLFVQTSDDLLQFLPVAGPAAR